MSAAYTKKSVPTTLVVLILSLVACFPATAGGQWSRSAPPFAAGALMAGAQGFARPPVNTAISGAYAYVPIGDVLVGGQVGASFGDGVRSRAAHALATLAFAQTRTGAAQFYPFVGIGAATLRARPGPNHVRLAVGAGFGADALAGSGRTSAMVGARVGFVARSTADDESVAYATITVGIGRRRDAKDKPRAVAARRESRQPGPSSVHW